VTKNRGKSAAARRVTKPKRGLPWPVWIGIGGLLLVLAGIAFLARPGTQAAAVAPQVTGQAKLAVDQEKIDFGTLPLDKTVQASFKLTNVGDEPLQMEGQPTIQVLKGC
jgi:hypothetical protein